MDRLTFDAQLNRLLSEAWALIPEEDLPDRPFLSGTDSGWYDFELKLWSKGEEIRQLIQSAGRKPSEQQISSILDICREKRAKRGRESFVLLLGRRQYAVHAEAIGQLLSDSNVAGHALEALYKMRAAGYMDRIVPFLHHEKLWIRKNAERYLKLFSEDSRDPF